MPAHRVIAFIDYQNVYHLARAAFGYESNPDKNLGHVHPLKVGQLLRDLGRSEFANRELLGVRVYRGDCHRHRYAVAGSQGHRVHGVCVPLSTDVQSVV